jgi:hypothetical protein
MIRATLARRCLQAALLIGLASLALTLLTVWSERRASAALAWHDPADDARPDAVALDLALLSLAGTPDEQVLELALETYELETARVLLTFGADLSDQQRLNGWLWLAYHYQQTGQTQRAARAYHVAGDGAVLSDQPPDLLRVEALLTVGQQLIALHDLHSARFYLEQAALISAHAPDLTAHHRRSLLERLVPSSLQAGGKRDDWAALAQAVAQDTAAQAGRDFDCPQVAPGYDAGLVQAQDARRAAAAVWLAELPASHGADCENYACLNLRQALLGEDAAMQYYLLYNTGQDAQLSRLHWLWLKRRVAEGGFGPGLVPQWEANRAQIRAALAQAWGDWLALFVPGQGDQENPGTDRRVLAVCVSRQAIVAAYWGLYPSAPIADLLSVSQGLTDFGWLHLTIVKPGTLPVVGWQEQTD